MAVMTDELTLHLANVCAFCEGDPCRCFSPPPPKVLSPQEVLRLGALTLQAESSEAVERLLEDQEAAYRVALKRQGPEVLIEALAARDRLLANQGRQIADGRTVSRIAREMVRAALYSTGGRPDAQAVQRAIDSFGGELKVADARQLKLHGSTLGPLADPEKVAEKLVDGSMKERPGSARVKDGALQQD
jgi:hypothetical protein